jgi:hypothetical protein
MDSVLPVPATATLHRVRRIQAITIAWMSVEVVMSLLAAWTARSPALVAFGGDSTVELLSATVVPWRFRKQTSCGRFLLGGLREGISSGEKHGEKQI